MAPIGSPPMAGIGQRGKPLQSHGALHGDRDHAGDGAEGGHQDGILDNDGKKQDDAEDGGQCQRLVEGQQAHTAPIAGSGSMLMDSMASATLP
ncbi:MAG: hypothetical protein M1547_12075 [Gammaproteobacteria bacterium]|nr:hypothetical protein [Gammaproteobacteria bacterium]